MGMRKLFYLFLIIHSFFILSFLFYNTNKREQNNNQSKNNNEENMILSIGEKISKEAKEGKRIQSTKVPVKVKSFGGKDDPKTTVESMNDLLTEEEKMMRKRSRSN